MVWYALPRTPPPPPKKWQKSGMAFLRIAISDQSCQESGEEPAQQRDLQFPLACHRRLGCQRNRNDASVVEAQ